jgi:hypothetical protein
VTQHCVPGRQAKYSATSPIMQTKGHIEGSGTRGSDKSENGTKVSALIVKQRGFQYIGSI